MSKVKANLNPERKGEKTMACRASGTGLRPDVADGDMLVLDPQAQPADGDIVLLEADGELKIKRYREEEGKVWYEYRRPEVEKDEVVRFEPTECRIIAVAIERWHRFDRDTITSDQSPIVSTL